MQGNLNEKFNDRFLQGDVAHLIKRCPHCESILLDKEQCSSCSKKVNVSKLGTPLGARTYFGIASRYRENQSRIIKLYPELENRGSKTAKKYRNDLHYRLKELSISDLSNPIFKMELVELLMELSLYEKSLDKIRSSMAALTPELLHDCFFTVAQSNNFKLALHPVSRWLDDREYGIERRSILSVIALIAVILLISAELPNLNYRTAFDFFR